MKITEVMQRSFSHHGKIATLPGIEQRLKIQRLQLDMMASSNKCHYSEHYLMDEYHSHFAKIQEIAKKLWTVTINL